MNQFTLIYDQNEEKAVQEIIVPAFEQSAITLAPFRLDNPDCSSVGPDSCVVTYLSDEALAEVVAGAMNKNWTLGFLPHPEMKEARQGYGISGNLTEAIEDILLNQKSIKADLLLCNGRPVFNAVVIGNSLSLMSGSVSRNQLLSGLEKISSTFRSMSSLVQRAYTITADNKPPLKTAALGIVAVLHGKSTLLSRLLLKDSYINDGRLHSLVLAPRSVMELLRFSISTFLKRKDNRKLPSFIGHIKTKSLHISSPNPMDFSQDNNLMSAKEIELVVCEGKFRILPGRYLNIESEAGEPTDKYIVKNLPKGEAYLSEVVAKPLSMIYHASTDEFKDLFKVLRNNAKATNSYLTLMVLATMLATLGLFSNSSPVIIGAMILAPLMAPIISLSMGVLRQENKLIFESAKTIGHGILLGYLAAIFLTLVTPLQNMNSEIISRIRPNLLDLGVAIVSGIAGAYAHAREEVAKTLAGVAIAVALVPPLAVSGIGIGWGEWQIFIGALLLFLTNLTGIVLSAALIFLMLGFSPFRLAKKGLLVSLFIVIMVSIPLGYGFMKMVREHSIIRSLNNHKFNNIIIKDVNVIQGGNPITLSVQLVSHDPIDQEDLRMVKQAISRKIKRDVRLEVITSTSL